MMYPFIASILCFSLPAWADPEGESPTPIGVTDLTLDERLRLVPVYHQDLETFVGVIDLISLRLDSLEWVLSLDAGRSMPAQPTRIGNTVDAARRVPNALQVVRAQPGQPHDLLVGDLLEVLRVVEGVHGALQVPGANRGNR